MTQTSIKQPTEDIKSSRTQNKSSCVISWGRYTRSVPVAQLGVINAEG
jgi:hypothetical protein